MSAVLVALHDDSLVKRLLDWTGGDLRLDSFITAVGEHLTNNLQTYSDQIHGRTVYLRNALNDLVMKPFDDLPYQPANPETELGREMHNYSRLFTGAFYDILVGIYEKLRTIPADRIAIHRTRDIVGAMLICAIELGPVGELDFTDMARAFLAAENLLYEGEYADVLKGIFDKRGLLSRDDADDFIEELANLPDIRLPESLDTALSASLFLEQKIAPALKLSPAQEFIPMSAYRNAEGYAYLTYFSHRRTTLSGEQFKQFNGSHIDIFGGLTLAFDPNNRLRSLLLRPVTDEDVRQINILTTDLIQDGLIVAGTQISAAAFNRPLHLQPGNPKGLWLLYPPLLDEPVKPVSTEPKLIKFPVIFDRMHQPMPDLHTYLTAWQSKMRRM